MLDDNLVLAKTIPRTGDPPYHQIVLKITDPGLVFLDDLAAEETWYAWIFDDPKRVVSLVKDRGDG